MNELSTLPAELAEIEDDRDSIAKRLRSAAERLESNGSIECESLVNDIELYKSRFETLASRLNLGNYATLSEIAARVSEISHLEPAKAILNRITTLRGVDGLRIGGIDSIVDRAATTAKGLDRLDRYEQEHVATAERLVKGNDDFNALLALIETPAELSDQTWNEYVDRTRRAFGPDVTTAVIRGRVTTDSLAADLKTT